MINEEKVKLMTRMAAYEQGEFHRHKSIIGFFRRDYISLQMVKSVIYTTLAFGVLLGLYVMYDFDLFMKEIYKMDIVAFIRTVIGAYLIMLGVFMLITYVVSLYRYNRSMQSVRLYYSNLKKLSYLYGEEK